jgi:hypothetical protein
MAADKQESGGRSVVSDPNVNRTNGGDSSGAALGQQASQASKGSVQSSSRPRRSCGT